MNINIYYYTLFLTSKCLNVYFPLFLFSYFLQYFLEVSKIFVIFA